MKQILLIVALLCGAWCAKAQDMTVATLDSQAGSQSFYGPDALKSAVEAAQEGDRITLSPGTFNAVNIDKSLKIQGAGFENNPEKGLYRTTITGYTVIGKEGAECSDLLLEGVFWDSQLIVRGYMESFTAKKCRFRDISFLSSNSKSSNKDTRIEHCRFTTQLNTGNNATNFTIYNSVVAYLGDFSSTSSVSALNTVFGDVGTTAPARFENCIFYTVHRHNHSLSKDAIVFNCVSYSSNAFKNLAALNNSVTLDESKEQIFKVKAPDENNRYSDDLSYELTDEAAAKYLGKSGGQVGIYGGYSPYNATPSNPQIVSKKIDERSSNGKLNVEIKVAAQN